MKKTVLFFDIETDLVSQSGDNEEYLKRIFDLLEEKQVHATLNTCGKVIEKFPALFKKFSAAGHEISSHGYNHENIVELNEKNLNTVLEKTERVIKKVSGEKPVGFRSPWLYTKPLLFNVLTKRGYEWVSNKRIRRKEILSNPSFQFSNSISSSFSRFLMASYLKLQWFFFPKKPFVQNDLTHIPLLSSMDGELLGLIDPNQHSSEKRINHVINSLQHQFFESKEYFNLTFHDWVVGSANRLEILSSTIIFLKKQRAKIVTARELVL